MTLQKHERILVVAAIGFLVYTFALSFLGPVLSSIIADKTYGNTGTVAAVGVGVYWDYNCTNPVNSFDWGFIEPSANKSLCCYIENTGNQKVVLSMSTSNWDPQNTTQFLTLTWDLEGANLDIEERIRATFTLTVSSSSQGITSFRFDVTIVGRTS